MKKIINGHGSIDKVTGKYKVHPKDRIESKKIIKKMFADVERMLIEKFGKVNKMEGEETPKYNKFIEQATGYLFVPVQEFSGANFQSTNREAFIHIDTGVNENGYNNEEVKRHFVISFELKGKHRYKYQKRWENDCTIIKKYVLADNFEEVTAEFENWLKNSYDNFFTGRLLQNKTWRECQR
jgi:hypothetical protein